MKKRRILAGVACLLLSIPAVSYGQALSPNLSFETPADKRGSLDTSARVGHRLSSEDETAQQPINWVGAGIQYSPIAQMIIDADFAFSEYNQTYLAQDTLPGQGSAKVVDEKRWDTGFNLGYNVIPPDVLDGRLALVPRLGLRVFWLDSAGFDLTGGGPQGGLTVGFEATDRLTLQGGFAYAHALFGDEDTPSVLGQISGLWSYDVGADLSFGERYGLRLSYVGETMVFEHTYRTSNGAALSLRFNVL